MRKCRLKSCRKPLPPMKACVTIYQLRNLCNEACWMAYDAEKRAEYVESKRAREASKPPAPRRPMMSRKKRRPRAGDDRSYLDWVKTQPCVLCGRTADDPHHIIGLGFGGMGMTAPDLFTIPVCRTDHRRIHADPELWSRQPRWVIETQAKAIKEGVL